MDALAEMLEQRKALGTCVDLRKSEGDYTSGNWLSRHGTLALRERLMRIALPTLEDLPDLEGYPETLPDILVEVGAPCLLDLNVEDTQLLRAITTRPEAVCGLEVLWIKEVDEGPDIQLLASVLAEGVWPKLHCLSFSDMNLGREKNQAILNGLAARDDTQARPLEILRFMDVNLTDEDVGDLANAIRQGKLALELWLLDLSGSPRITDCGATLLAAALE